MQTRGKSLTAAAFGAVILSVMFMDVTVLPASPKDETMKDQLRVDDGRHDFDFLRGTYLVHNRRLRERLKGSTEWDEFEATNASRELLGGMGNEDEYRTDFWPNFTGMTFRFFDPAAKRWAIYWADSRRSTLDPPVFGSFTEGRGVFEGTDTLDGKAIRIRFIWSGTNTATPRWEQAFSPDDGKTWETNWVWELRRPGSVASAGATAPGAAGALTSVQHLGAFDVVELRRYTITPGGRETFARYFESYFPEAFEQLGAIAFGDFFERAKPDHFTWLRGFRDIESRAIVNSAFYYGPLWKEHKKTLNNLIVDSDDVLLLRPLRPTTRILVLPAVDVVGEAAGTRGLVAAQIFAVRPESAEAFARQAEAAFTTYRGAGLRDAGILVTLDVANNFPQLPVRADGPYLVWLGLLEDEQALGRLQPLAEEGAKTLAATGLLRTSPEWVVLDPADRSRLRWLPD